MEVGHTEGSVYLNTLDTVFVRYFWGRHIGCGCACLITCWRSDAGKRIQNGGEVNVDADCCLEMGKLYIPSHALYPPELAC